MSKITVLGLGAMGSRMAANLIAAKHDVTVWNRTATAAEPLLSQHVTQASSPREAVDGAEFVIAMLRDDAASQQVWLDPHTGALAGMAAGSVAIESSTLTPTWIKTLGAQMSHHNVSLLEAPVSGSRPQAEAGQLVYLVGGHADTLQRSRSLLEEMGSSVHHVGALGDGALVKLATNALMGIQVTALAEIIGLLKRHGTDVNKALAAIAGTSVWAPIATYLSNTMLNGNFAPLFPVELIEKDFAYTLSAVGSTGAAPTVAAAHDVFRQALERNLGQENMTSVVKLFTE